MATTNVTKSAVETMLEQRNAEMQKELDALKAKLAEKNTITVKTAKFGKGTVSVYGIQRNPITLYGPQWETLATYIPAVLKFYEDNKDGSIRASAFASEFTLKLLGMKSSPDPKDKANTERYQAEWTKAFDMAMADSKLIPTPRT